MSLVKSTFQGVEIVQHIDSPGTEDEYSSWQAHIDRTLVLGYTREWVEQCIVRLKKEEIVEPKGNPVLNLNLPLKSLFLDSFGEEDGEGDRAAFDALGLLGIETFSCRVELFDTEMIVDNNLTIDDLDLATERQRRMAVGALENIEIHYPGGIFDRDVELPVPGRGG